MPPKRTAATTNGKRKASSSSPSVEDGPETNGHRINKKPKTSSIDLLCKPHHSAHETEENGIVLRQYYPHEMHNDRCAAYNADKLPRPIELLSSALQETCSQRKDVKVKNSVVHWSKCDLRTKDNNALFLAGQKAKEAKVPLICMYLVSPQDFEAHLTSPSRVDFILRSLQVLKDDLAQLDIPLYVETIDKRKDIPSRILSLLSEWGTSHLFANMEYEVDELRREAKLVRSLLKDHNIAFDVVHDTCVVPPGTLTSGSGKQYSVYSPWFRAWVAHLHDNWEMLDLFDQPPSNPPDARKKFSKLFSSPIPAAPKNKTLSKEQAKTLPSLWPAGESAAQERLAKFADSRLGPYQDHRNFPAENATSCLSVHFASGTLSARTAIRTARDHNSTKKLDRGHDGIIRYISEVAWRDFYKHVLAHWPYVCMNKPFKPEYSNISWSYDQDLFKAWCEGRTGYPIVDAAMRQLNSTAYMHNRCRMIAASFLAKDLCLDWRMGERYFMEHLIDGDFASNNGGWGFSASTGVDPQPYFRIFNPLLQSEKFDPEGKYIRKWVKELEGVEGGAIHDPYERGAEKEAAKKGYPRRIVEHKESRDKALAMYKEGLGRDTA